MAEIVEIVKMTYFDIKYKEKYCKINNDMLVCNQDKSKTFKNVQNKSREWKVHADRGTICSDNGNGKPAGKYKADRLMWYAWNIGFDSKKGH